MNELWAFLLMCSVRSKLFIIWLEAADVCFHFELPRLPHLVCRHLSYSDEICLWKVRLDWLIQFAGETIRSNSCCAWWAHTITGFVFLTPASVNIMTADQVCRGHPPRPWQQQAPDIWRGPGVTRTHLTPASHRICLLENKRRTITTQTFWLLIKTSLVNLPQFSLSMVSSVPA